MDSIPEASDERVLMSDRPALRDDIILSLLYLSIGGFWLESNLCWVLVNCGVASNSNEEPGVNQDGGEERR